MRINVPRSLDRPVDIFTVRGNWIKIFLILAGLCLFAAFIVGAVMGIGIAMIVFMSGVLGSFLFCMIRQDKLRHRDISKLQYVSSCRQDISRRETASMILREAPKDRPVLWQKSVQRNKEDI